MRNLFIISTIIFWLALAGFWLAAGRQPAPLLVPASPIAPAAPVAAVAPVANISSPEYSLKEVSKHNQENNCWMAIEGQVYDVTPYLPAHPSDPALVLPWCGKEASKAWQTKTVGRPHSPYADRLLKKYSIGKLRVAR